LPNYIIYIRVHMHTLLAKTPNDIFKFNAVTRTIKDSNNRRNSNSTAVSATMTKKYYSTRESTRRPTEVLQHQREYPKAY